MSRFKSMPRSKNLRQLLSSPACFSTPRTRLAFSRRHHQPDKCLRRCPRRRRTSIVPPCACRSRWTSTGRYTQALYLVPSFFSLLLDPALDVLLDLIDRETRRGLTRRIVHEGLQEGTGVHGHPPHQVGVLDPPVIVLVGHDVRPLERVHAQVEELRDAQAGKGFIPDGEASRLVSSRRTPPSSSRAGRRPAPRRH